MPVRPRCPFAEEECWEVAPEPVEYGDGHRVECHRADEVEYLRSEAEKHETWTELESTETDDELTETEVKMTERKIQVRDVKKHFPVDDGALSNLFGFGEDQSVKAVDGVSFDIDEGEAFGIAGESGCGKTTLAETILQLEEPTDGEITIDGRDVTEMDKGEINALRSDVQIIQQDPYQSLNPRFTVVQWVQEPLDIHDIGPKDERRETVRETLAEVGLRPPENYMDEYTSELSGGERQRVGIARAIVSNPSFVVCDEPVSMLDVSIRASILRLLDDLRTEKGISFMYISHDLSLLKHVCDRIGIMYLGRFVETGPSTQVINDPNTLHTGARLFDTDNQPRRRTGSDRALG